ncbi:MAG: hypothetical protein ACREVE_08645 [Gammaproteobacteria bacterium]
MKILIPLKIVVAYLFGVGQARGEYRSVLIVVTHAREARPQVTIRSELEDEQDEQKESMSVDQACKLIKKMAGSMSAIEVSVVLEGGLAGRDAEKLLKAIFDNAWLTLTYLGPDMPKEFPAIALKAK